jgi:anti-sigma B factor antagonist
MSEMLEGGLNARVLVDEVEGRGITVLYLQDSYLNLATAEEVKPLLKQHVREHIAADKRRFVLNLENVGVIDSCGLAVLISLKKLVDGNNGRLALSNLSALTDRLFALTRLHRAFDVFGTEEEAIAAL